MMTRVPRMKVLCCVLMLTVTLGLAESVLAFSNTVSEQKGRTLQGEVVAINVTDFPQVIVVKAMTVKKQELIVGAVVESGTVITRGAQRVTLDNLKVGESVAITYLKGPDGLVAHSIHAK
ncbi:MAG: hypothetical protein HY281_03190 [Nitrospirae bacterium]|nr:hypothetical protein [Nitrospirota bacterium]